MQRIYKVMLSEMETRTSKIALVAGTHVDFQRVEYLNQVRKLQKMSVSPFSTLFIYLLVIYLF